MCHLRSCGLLLLFLLVTTNMVAAEERLRYAGATTLQRIVVRIDLEARVALGAADLPRPFRAHGTQTALDQLHVVREGLQQRETAMAHDRERGKIAPALPRTRKNQNHGPRPVF